MDEKAQIEQAIDQQEALRGAVPDAVIDTTLDALRRRLAELTRGAASQRKQVTVLFADVSGFTALSETRDPEEVADAFGVIWGRLDRIITDHGGRIDKHIGDAVMALWGTEIAGEDDPENAVRAALAMQEAIRQIAPADWVGSELSIHIGINTGPVLLGEVGTTGEYTAMGDTVNVASRLESACPAGGVLVGHDTYRHVRGIFGVAEQPPLEVKGKRDPLRTYLVTGIQPRAFRLGARGVEGVEIRMVGRSNEFAQLQALVHATLDDRTLHPAMVVGEAGIGKSRLLYEFHDWLELHPVDMMLLRGRADAQREGTPYSLIQDLVFFRFEISENDPTDVAVAKLEHGFAEHGGAGPESAHLVAHLIGFDMAGSPHVGSAAADPRQLRDRSVRAFSDLIGSIADRMPTVVLLEDLHWADLASLDVVEHAVAHLQSQPVAVVALARPSLYERRPEWGAGWLRIDLAPLSRQDAEDLVAEVLQHVAEIPSSVLDTIVSAAAGNPFYVEELVKTMIEDGTIVVSDAGWTIDRDRVARFRVPPTLTAVLQARLDRLPTHERTTLQQASVVGKVFWDKAIARLSSAIARSDGEESLASALGGLKVRELIFSHRESGFGGAQEFSFKHSLLHDVAYDSVLLKERRIYHEAVAGWLIDQADPELRAALIAAHFEAAGALARAAFWYARSAAGERVRYANEDALAHYARALELGSVDDDLEIEILDGMAEVLTLLARYDEAVAIHRRMLDTARAHGIADAEARALTGISFVELRRGEFDPARSAADEAVTLIRSLESPDQALLSEALRRIGWLDMRAGDLERAHRRADEARTAAVAGGDQPGVSKSLNLLGRAASLVGNHEGARAHLLEALAVDRALGDRRAEGSTLINLGEAARVRGEYDEAAQRYREALEIQRDLGDRDLEGLSLSNLGGAYLGLGRFDEARDWLTAALDVFDAAGGSEHRSETNRFLAEVYLGLGDPWRALEHAQVALIYGRQAGDPGDIGHAWRVLGQIAAQTGEPVIPSVDDDTMCDVDACFRESVASLAESDSARAVTLADWARASLALDPVRAHELWTEAVAILRARGLERLAGRLEA